MNCSSSASATMSDIKQVKVDNWGIYFLQRLKHFFNRTDYCDLTLQFQDNAQLKVHRLVLSACTEYFELLERTCEMYEDCLVMPDDLQANVVVPIVNFMYTGQLEFKMDILEKLFQTSEIMNMPVLTKLLDSHRVKPKVSQSYTPKRPSKQIAEKEVIKSATPLEVVTAAPLNKRNFKGVEKQTVYRDKRVYLPHNKTTQPVVKSACGRIYRDPSPIPLDTQVFNKKVVLGEPRPTRYELPEELDTDNIFENSFCNISYTSQPLMVHPETRKQYGKRPRAPAGEASVSKKFKSSTVDIVHCKQMPQSNESMFDESIDRTVIDDNEMFPPTFMGVKEEPSKDPNHLFDQMLDQNEGASKVTIETKSNKGSGNLDHAKIISEVLKKYPHLVKSNKNIKLKILNTPSKTAKKQKVAQQVPERKVPKIEKTESDYTYETDVLDSKQAAKLIAMGAENIEGPWICLICGTPGRAMNFTTYYKFRRHLVEVHREKPVLNICEHCGHKTSKRNYLLHHLYTKHGVQPPPQYHFPKCNQCSYIALTEGLLVKHKASHLDYKSFRCNVCSSSFHSSNQLLIHIQNTGHKYSADRKTNLQCIYCLKVFLRESNLYAHLKTNHKTDAFRDGIIDYSDDERDEKQITRNTKNINVKCEPTTNDYEELNIQYQIQQNPDGNIQVVTKKQTEPTKSRKQKILNTGFTTTVPVQNPKSITPTLNDQNEFNDNINISSANDTHEEIVMIDNNEYIVRDNQLVPRRSKSISDEFILGDQNIETVAASTSMEFTATHENIEQANIILKNSTNLSQPIPIYVSNEEEYKALMASNHPIIFDTADSNKTLTVLTAPHTSSLDTAAIDLDNTQSNDMMIIQDDYPLTVSETVAANNSNIVVVYSQIGDQNKQYQLLTTQGLGAQFVQSSAIITQNYETVTTTAPVMSVPALDKQVEGVWHSDIHQIVDTEQMDIPPVAAHQPIELNQAQVIESNADMSDLPQVELAPASNVLETTSLSGASVAESHSVDTEVPTEILQQPTEEVVMDTVDNASSISIETDVPAEPPVEEIAVSKIPTGESEENIPGPPEQDLGNTAHEAVFDESNADIPAETESVQEAVVEQVDEDLVQPEEVNMDFESAEINENLQPAKEKTSVPEPNDDISEDLEEPTEPNDDISEDVEEPTNNKQYLDAEEAVDKIQSLTSEWSEEDPETHKHETLQQNVGDTTDNVAQIEIHTSDVEESIENIQQEVEKQMAETSTVQENGAETNDNVDPVEDVSEPHQDKPDTVTAEPAEAQEKISSLLNDWEDNDSQEDANSVDENVPAMSDEIVETTPAEGVEPSAGVKENLNKQDNIKSLVSDWDEDEEENKE